MEREPTTLLHAIRRHSDLPGNAEAAFETFCKTNPNLRVEQKHTGEIIILPPAGNESSDRNAEIIFQLKLWNNKDKKGRVFDSNTVFRMPDGSKMGPDAAWVSKQKLSAFPRANRKQFLPVVPEFIIELRSPSDDLAELLYKMEDWIRNGVELAWMIDADQAKVWIYTADETKEMVGPASVAGTGAVAGFNLVLAEIYQGLDF